MIGLTFAVATFLFSTSAFANNTITINWHNETNQIMYGTLYYCQPMGTCERPMIGIPPFQTHTIVQTVSPDTYSRSMALGYSYSHETEGRRACRVWASAAGPLRESDGPSCQKGSADVSVQITDGYIPLSSCVVQKSVRNHEKCDYVYDVYFK